MEKLPELVAQEKEALIIEQTVPEAAELPIETIEPVLSSNLETEVTDKLPELDYDKATSEIVEPLPANILEDDMPEIEQPVVGEGITQTTTEKEEELSFDELFALQPDAIEFVAADEEEEDGEDKKDKKKKDKKKRHVEIVYNEEDDVLVYRKKHKHEGDEWAEWES